MHTYIIHNQTLKTLLLIRVHSTTRHQRKFFPSAFPCRSISKLQEYKPLFSTQRQFFFVLPSWYSINSIIFHVQLPRSLSVWNRFPVPFFLFCSVMFWIVVQYVGSYWRGSHGGRVYKRFWSVRIVFSLSSRSRQEDFWRTLNLFFSLWEKYCRDC